MDQTAVSVLFFTIMRTVLWICVVLYGVIIARRIVRAMDTTPDEMGRVFSAHLRGVVLWIVIFVGAVTVSTMETAYRPKTVIAPRDEFSERMRAQKERPLPSVKAVPARPSWEEVDKKNKEENEKARQEFDVLPK